MFLLLGQVWLWYATDDYNTTISSNSILVCCEGIKKNEALHFCGWFHVAFCVEKWYLEWNQGQSNHHNDVLIQPYGNMTEVKQSDSGHLGLFATKNFHPGNVILQESPIVVVNGKGESSKMSASIEVPSSIDSKFHGTFRSMVQVGLYWIDQQVQDENTEKVLLSLYFPSSESSSEHEKEVLKVAMEASNFLKNQKKDFKNWDIVEKIMLIWACNAFEKGRIYPEISRVNHCCNPTAIIQPDGEAQRLVAAADIAKGDEIVISYLGLMLYADTRTRKDRLARTKFFECQCDRCSCSDDPAGRIPCPSCHPRQSQQSLDEDTQYDDDQAVSYVTPNNPCSKCNSKLDTASTLTKFMSTVTSKVVSYLDSQEGAKSSKSEDADGQDDVVLEEHVSLASTIMGDKHWTTNLLLLLHLDRRLSSMSSTMLTTQEVPEMEEVAEIIDSLQRVNRFVDSLELRLHSGHILGDVIIGTARTLVSLGDEKSQKYGAEWLDKITDYVSNFENEGRQKVVSALRVAWKKKNGRDDETDGRKTAAKKLKS
eukprot:scaffold26550_cov122-Cylindrotheca_fusiformis.AAC.4